VLGSGTAEYRTPDEASDSPLAERLFAVGGVGGVFFGGDFITSPRPMANAAPEAGDPRRDHEHFMSGAPVLSRAPIDDSGEEFFAAGDAETVATIRNS